MVDLEQRLQYIAKDFLKSKASAWADSTIKSETARLLSLIKRQPDFYLNPEAFWESMSDLAPYTRQTTWIRGSTFASYLIDKGFIEGPNKLEEWREQNARAFKNNYQRKTTAVSIDEARSLIRSIPNETIRAKCLQLLNGGLRYSESLTLRDGEVRGKGNKTRKVFVDSVAVEPTYWEVYSALKEVGLTPHMLRKIKATDVSRKGARPEQLCALFGWTSFNTAQSYLNEGTEEELKKLMEKNNNG